MALWPVDNKIVSIKDRIIKPVHKQKSAANYTMTFPKSTVKKRGLKVSMSWLTKAEKDTIETFFDVNQGLLITLNSPDPNYTTVHSVIIDQDELEFEYIDIYPNGEYNLDINFLEP